MTDKIKCFLLEPTEQVELSLRRFVWSDVAKCEKSGFSFHTASVVIGREPKGISGGEDSFPHNDVRWPKVCACGYEFTAEDEWQVNRKTLYARADTSEVMTLDNPPAGAMWFAPWLSEVPAWCGPDGKTLVVQLPDRHEWIVDSRASNCTRLDDSVHKCWVRHGTPPDVTVDKNGDTCAAGAGSILVPGWHGFLRNGYLERC